MKCCSADAGDRFKHTKQDQGEDAEMQFHQVRLAIPRQAIVWQDRGQVSSHSLGDSVGFGHGLYAEAVGRVGG